MASEAFAAVVSVVSGRACVVVSIASEECSEFNSVVSVLADAVDGSCDVDELSSVVVSSSDDVVVVSTVSLKSVFVENIIVVVTVSGGVDPDETVV